MQLDRPGGLCGRPGSIYCFFSFDSDHDDEDETHKSRSVQIPVSGATVQRGLERGGILGGTKGASLFVGWLVWLDWRRRRKRWPKRGSRCSLGLKLNYWLALSYYAITSSRLALCVRHSAVWLSLWLSFCFAADDLPVWLANAWPIRMSLTSC